MFTFAILAQSFSGFPNNPEIPQWPAYVPDGGVMCIDTSWQIEEGYWKKDFHFWQDRFQENALLQKNV